MPSITAQPRAWVPNARFPSENEVAFPLLGHSDARCTTCDTACTDQDEAEERDVVHRELCQFPSDACEASVEST